jgi:hypothetical protein
LTGALLRGPPALPVPVPALQVTDVGATAMVAANPGLHHLEVEGCFLLVREGGREGAGGMVGGGVYSREAVVHLHSQLHDLQHGLGWRGGEAERRRRIGLHANASGSGLRQQTMVDPVHL